MAVVPSTAHFDSAAAKPSRRLELSAARLAANRRNALKSTGPRTLEGEARAAPNARTHGALSEEPIRPHDRADFARHVGKVFAEHGLETPVEMCWGVALRRNQRAAWAGLWALNMVLAVVAIAVGQAAAQPAEPAKPDVKSVLPRSSELGPGWKFPWEEAPDGITEADWRARFHDDPRQDLRLIVLQLSAMTDEQYREYAEATIKLGNALAAGDSGPAAGVTTKPAAPVVTRQQALDRAQAIADGITDIAENDYARSTPKPGAKENDIGIVPSDEDSLNLKLVVYSGASVAAHTDVDGAAVALAVDVTSGREQADKAKAEKSAAEHVTRYNVLAEADLAHTGEARSLLHALVRMSTETVRVGGKVAAAGDASYLFWTERRSFDRHTITITGRLRFGRAVVDFNRTSSGVYAPAARQETEALLADLVKRLAPFGNPPS